MKEFTLYFANNQFWGQGLLVKTVNNEVVKTWDINNFYNVIPEYFIIYDTTGGSGSGFSKGEILHKIFIGDAEFQKVNVWDIDHGTITVNGGKKIPKPKVKTPECKSH